MTEQDRKADAAARLRDTLDGWREAAQGGVIPGNEAEEGCGRGILSVEERRCTDVLLTYGGPTAYLRFIHDGEHVTEAAYLTTEPNVRGSEGIVEVPLLTDEAREVFELLGLGGAA
jgi:hypothetical protein